MIQASIPASKRHKHKRPLVFVSYPDSDYVRMLIVFPDDKPFKSYRLEAAPNSREKVQPFQGESAVLVDDAKKGLRWEIPKPLPGYVFRLSWDW
jgi:hypothetical protein